MVCRGVREHWERPNGKGEEEAEGERAVPASVLSVTRKEWQERPGRGVSFPREVGAPELGAAPASSCLCPLLQTPAESGAGVSLGHLPRPPSKSCLFPSFFCDCHSPWSCLFIWLSWISRLGRHRKLPTLAPTLWSYDAQPRGKPWPARGPLPPPAPETPRTAPL